MEMLSYISCVAQKISNRVRLFNTSDLILQRGILQNNICLFQ